jgi:hypothetical protein
VPISLVPISLVPISLVPISLTKIKPDINNNDYCLRKRSTSFIQRICSQNRTTLKNISSQYNLANCDIFQY